MNSLRIKVWNARGLQWYKREIIKKWIEVDDIDIVIIQETWFLDMALLQQLQYFVAHSPAHPYQRNDKKQEGGICVFASQRWKPLLNVRLHNRYCIQVDCNGISIGIVYLRPSADEEYCLENLSRVSQCQIIAGDVNASFRESAPRTSYVKHLPRNETLGGFMQQHGFSILRPSHGGTLLDQVLWRDGAPMIEWKKDIDKYGSDHSPMDIKICTQENTTNAGPEDEDCYQIANRILMHCLTKPLTPEKKEGCALAVKLFRQHALLITDDISELESTVQTLDRESLQAIIDYMDASLVEAIYESASKAFGTYDAQAVKTRCRTRVDNDEEKHISNIDKAILAIKRSQRTRIKTPLVSRTADRTPAQDAKMYYQELFASNKPETPVPTGDGVETEEAHIKEMSRRGRMAEIYQSSNIKRVIEKYPKYKVGGGDGIHAKLLQLLIECDIHVILSKLFTLYATFAITPTGWNQTHICLLEKRPKANTVDDMRPITLSSIIRRMFEKVLLSHWQQQEWATCSRLQSGFIKRKSTLIAALNVDESIKRGNRLCALLDVQSAYDTVPHEKLIEIMRNRGASIADIQLFHSLNAHQAYTRLVVNGKLGSPIAVRRGVAQGSILSPLLFNVAFDTLLRKLDDGTNIPSASGFADDLAVMGRNGHIIQARLDICTEWALEMGMIWNVSKCIIIGLKNADNDLLLAGQIIPRLNADESTKYVGYNLSRLGIEWETSLNRMCQKASGALALIDNVGNKCNAAVKAQLVKTFARSITDYVIAPFHAWMCLDRGLRFKHLTPLAKVHQDSLAFIAGTASTHNAHVIESMAMMPPPEARAVQLRASVHDQLQRLPHDAQLLQLANSVPPHDSVLYTLAKGKDPLSQAIKRKQIPTKVAARKWIEHHVTRYDGRSLHAYVTPPARVKGVSRVDACLYQTHDVFAKALAWRRNVVWLNSSCYCGKRFDRSHVDNCGFYPLANNQDTVKWLQERKVPTRCYNSGDEFLNTQQYDKFLALWESVSLIEDMVQWDGAQDDVDELPKERFSQAGLWRTSNGQRVPTLMAVETSVAEWEKSYVGL